MEAGDDGAPLRLVVGLGNPGRDYAETRHNVGFMIADALAAEAGVRFDEDKRWKTLIAKAGTRYLIKPQTYMNESGVAVGKVSAFYKIAPEEMLVIYDDLDLPLGRLRLRGGGSAGGHNGMKSIIAHLGTQQFPRLRVGIGRRGDAAIGHVLGKFAKEERSELEKSIKNAVLATALIAGQGLSAAMTRFNSSGEPKQRKPKAAPSAEKLSSEAGTEPAEGNETPNK